MKQYFWVSLIFIVLICKIFCFVYFAICWHCIWITFETLLYLYWIIVGLHKILVFICVFYLFSLLLLINYYKFVEFYFHCELVRYHIYALIPHNEGRDDVFITTRCLTFEEKKTQQKENNSWRKNLDYTLRSQKEENEMGGYFSKINLDVLIKGNYF